MTFSACPKTGDHRLVEEKRIPSITDILIDQAGKMKKVWNMMGDYRQNVFTNLRLCFEFYRALRNMIKPIFYCFTFYDKPDFL